MKYTLFIFALLPLLGTGCASGSIPSGSPNAPSPAPRVSENSSDLSGKNLNALPASILSQTHLVELDISNNQMTGALPAEIRSLQKLKFLNASDNQFTGIPAEIGQLRELETLDFSNNHLTGIPHELGNLQKLRVLNLSGNDISEFDLNIIREALPGSTQILL